jgi:hypothetical protein
MHPDLYLTIHQQRERELEALLRHRLAAEERAPVEPGPRRQWTVAPLLERLLDRVRAVASAPRVPDGCCPA